MVARFNLIFLIMMLVLASMNLCADEREVKITGAILQALIITENDFKGLLVVKNKPSNETEIFLADIKNYTITITENENFITVVYIPIQVSGKLIAGGGGQYSVSKDGKKILNKQYFS